MRCVDVKFKCYQLQIKKFPVFCNIVLFFNFTKLLYKYYKTKNFQSFRSIILHFNIIKLKDKL